MDLKCHTFRQGADVQVAAAWGSWSFRTVKENSSEPLARRSKRGSTQAARKRKVPSYQGQRKQPTAKKKEKKASQPSAKKLQKTSKKASEPLARQHKLSQQNKRKEPTRRFAATVSDEQHALECQEGSKKKRFCIRCDFGRRREVYKSWSLHDGRPWLAKGVNRGLWGLGCVLCAQVKLASSASCGKNAMQGFRNFQTLPSAQLLQKQRSGYLRPMRAQSRIAVRVEVKSHDDALTQSPTHPTKFMSHCSQNRSRTTY